MIRLLAKLVVLFSFSLTFVACNLLFGGKDEGFVFDSPSANSTVSYSMSSGMAVPESIYISGTVKLPKSSEQYDYSGINFNIEYTNSAGTKVTSPTVRKEWPYFYSSSSPVESSTVSENLVLPADAASGDITVKASLIPDSNSITEKYETELVLKYVGPKSAGTISLNAPDATVASKGIFTLTGNVSLASGATVSMSSIGTAYYAFTYSYLTLTGRNSVNVDATGAFSIPIDLVALGVTGGSVTITVWAGSNSWTITPATVVVNFNLDSTPPTSLSATVVTDATGLTAKSTVGYYYTYYNNDAIYLKVSATDENKVTGFIWNTTNSTSTGATIAVTTPSASVSEVISIPTGGTGTPAIPVGTSTLYIWASDGTNYSYSPTSFSLNVIAYDLPVLSITDPADQYSQTTADLAVSLQATDGSNPVTSVKVSVDAEAFQNATQVGTTTSGLSNWTYTLTGLAEKAYTLKAFATDSLGKVTPTISQVFYIDNTAPVISSAQVKDSTGGIVNNGATTADNNFIITVVATDAVSGVKTAYAYLDGSLSGIPMTVDTVDKTKFTYAWNGMSSGNHSFSVKVIDGSGKETTNSGYAFVKSTKPTLTLNGSATVNIGSSINTAATTISGTYALATSPAGVTLNSVTCSRTGTATGAVTCTVGSGTWSFEVPMGTADGSYTYTVVATDSNGLQSAPLSIAIAIDKTAPVITAPSISATAQSGAIYAGVVTVSCTVNDNLAGVQSVSVAMDADGYALAANPSGTTWTFTYPSALAAGPHTFHIKAMDKSSNESAISDISFDYSVMPSVTPTWPAGSAIDVSAYPVPVTAAFNSASGNYIEWSIGNESFGNTTAVSAASFSGTINVTLSLVNADNTIYMRARDQNGLVSTTSQKIVYYDTLAPTVTLSSVTEGQVIKQASTSVTLSGTYTEPNLATTDPIQIAVSTNAGSSYAAWANVSVDTTAKTWSYALTAIDGTSYMVKLRARDSFAVGATSAWTSTDDTYSGNHKSVTNNTSFSFGLLTTIYAYGSKNMAAYTVPTSQAAYFTFSGATTGIHTICVDQNGNPTGYDAKVRVQVYTDSAMATTAIATTTSRYVQAALTSGNVYYIKVTTTDGATSVGKQYRLCVVSYATTN